MGNFAEVVVDDVMTNVGEVTFAAFPVNSGDDVDDADKTLAVLEVSGKSGVLICEAVSTFCARLTSQRVKL